MDRSEQALVVSFSSEILVFSTTFIFGGIKIVADGITVFGFFFFFLDNDNG